MNTVYSSNEIVTGFKTRNKVIVEYVYKTFRPMVNRYITLNSGTIADADEILHIAILKLYNRIYNTRGRLAITNFDSYFMAIVRKTWSKSITRKNKSVLYGNDFFAELEISDENEMEMEMEMLYNTVYEKFEMLPEGCRKILTLYYIEDYRMKEIAEMLGYKNQAMAIKQKFRCLNYLKMMLKNKL